MEKPRMNLKGKRKFLLPLPLIAVVSVTAVFYFAYHWHQKSMILSLVTSNPTITAPSATRIKELITQLENPECPVDPGKICLELMQAKGDADCVRAIVRYIERNERYDSYMWRIRKASALQNIGYIGGSEASTVLQKAFTEQGAQTLTQAWLHDPIPEDQEKGIDVRMWTLCSFRMQAAIALAHTGNPADMEAVEREYYRIAAIRRQDQRYSRPWNEVEHTFTDEEKRTNSLFTALVSAMAERDVAVIIGRPVPPIDPETYLKLVDPYIAKYNVPKPPT